MYAKRIEEIDAGIKESQGKRKVVLAEWVDEHHPLAIGEVVEINGYSHKGKKMRVQSRGVEKIWENVWQWTASGHVYKINGKLGLHAGEWREIVKQEK